MLEMHGLVGLGVVFGVGFGVVFFAEAVLQPHSGLQVQVAMRLLLTKQY